LGRLGAAAVGFQAQLFKACYWSVRSTSLFLHFSCPFINDSVLFKGRQLLHTLVRQSTDRLMILQKLRIPQNSNDRSTQSQISSHSQKNVDTSHYNYFDSVQTPIDPVNESTSYVDPSYIAIDQSNSDSPLSPIITPQLASRISSRDCGSHYNSNFCILPPDSTHFPHPGERVSTLASPDRTHVAFWSKKERNHSLGTSSVDIQTTQQRENYTSDGIDTFLAFARAFCWVVEFGFCVAVITLLIRTLQVAPEVYIPYERLPVIMALIAGIVGSITATFFFFIQPSLFTGSVSEKCYIFRRFFDATTSPCLLILWVTVTSQFKKMDGLPIGLLRMSCGHSESPSASLCKMQTTAFFCMIALCIISFIIVVADVALWNNRRTRK